MHGDGISSKAHVANKDPAHKKTEGRSGEHTVTRRVRVSGPNQSSPQFVNNAG